MTRINLRHMILAAFFASLTAVLAYISIPLPFSPVPVTGQTAGVMLAGYLLTGGQALLSQIIYILMGVIGIPVFSGGRAGIGILAGPSGGFIWGFLPAAYFLGRKLRGNQSKYKKFFVLLVGGILLIYFFGAVQMMIVLDLGLGEVLVSGLLPYIPGDIFKIIFVLMVGSKIERHRILT